jgi:uncharacterized membrane protein YidH (DUF202 family)
MSQADSKPAVVRPKRMVNEPVPPVPVVDERNAEAASTTYSHYRTGLSNHRTHLSEHRTDLSEYRTDLSGERTEMSMRRTGLSFQRTRLSGDRTLMSVIRTSLSLIGFGFTIYEAFRKLHESGVLQRAQAPRNFGLTLVVLGVLLLIGGLIQEMQFSGEIRRQREAMIADGLIHGQSHFPLSITTIVAIALLLVGLVAVASIVFNISLFG